MTAALAMADTLPAKAVPPAVTRLMLRAMVAAELASLHSLPSGAPMGLVPCGHGRLWRAEHPGHEWLDPIHADTVHALCRRGILRIAARADRAVITPLGLKQVARIARMEPGDIADGSPDDA